MSEKDVTSEVQVGDIDGEHLEVERCICGTKFERWAFVLSIYPDLAKGCPECGRRLYFKYKVTVLEVSE